MPVFCRLFGGFFLFLFQLGEHHERGAEDTQRDTADTGEGEGTRVEGGGGGACTCEGVCVALPVEVHTFVIVAVGITGVVELLGVRITEHMQQRLKQLPEHCAADAENDHADVQRTFVPKKPEQPVAEADSGTNRHSQ